MQIVIDIPDKAYKYFAQGLRYADEVEMAIIAIVDGTPLPEGHGELINRKHMLDNLRNKVAEYRSTIDNAISEDELKIEGMKEAYADCLQIIDKYIEESRE